MLTNELRSELSLILAETECCRIPSLRRCRREEWLYITDLPGLCSEEDKQKAIKSMNKAGWETEEENNRLLLRKNLYDPPGGWYTDEFGPEAGCCLSLLRRHHKRGQGAEEIQRMLIRAGEEGNKSYENACGKIHKAWAERLRENEPLPEISLKWFGA